MGVACPECIVAVHKPKVMPATIRQGPNSQNLQCRHTCSEC